MKTPLSFVFVFVLVLFITGCGCLTPPSDDSTAPKTNVAVIYYDESGQEVRKSVNSDEENDLSVEIPKGSAFEVIFRANDEEGEGVQSLKAEHNITLKNEQSFMSEQNITGAFGRGCFKQDWPITKSYDWEEEVSEYKFQATAADYNGNESKTPILTVKLGG